LVLIQWVQAAVVQCPKCHFDHALQTTECLKCGIIFSRYQAALEAEQAGPPPPEPISSPLPLSPDEPDIARGDAVRELQYRVFALPLALLLAWLVARTPFRMAEGMLAMVVHGCGHAISAWLTGRWAIPMLWVTPHGESRSWFIVLFLAAAFIFLGYLAWRAERWGWVAAAGTALLLQMIFLNLPAESTIVFCGDGGAMVLATMLMATFYSPRESRIYKSWGLRWGLLVIGAMAFLHVFLMWKGPLEDLPFGEIEGVNLSDPSLLTEMYGWTVLQLVDRYVRLGTICLVVLLALYVLGLVSAYLKIQPRTSAQPQRALAKPHP